MKNYYSNSIEYNDDLDAFEARMRAEQEEIEIEEKPACCCYEYVGDNSHCPVHGSFFDDDSTAWDKERNDLKTMGQGG